MQRITRFTNSIVGSRARTVTFAAMLLAVSAVGSAALAIVRDRLLARQFGAGDVTDIYFAAFRVPDLLLHVLVLGAISAAFLPIFAEAFEKDKEAGWRFASNLLSLVSLFLLVLAVLLVLVAPLVMPLVAPGFSGEKLARTIFLTRLFSFSMVFLGISGIFSSILQYTKRFLLYAFAPIVYNLGIIIGIVFFAPGLEERGVGLGVVLGALFHVGVQVPGVLRSGLRFRFQAFPIRLEVVRMAFLSLPRIANILFNQSALIVINAFGSLFAVGSIAVWNFAENIQAIAISIIGASFALATFPHLARAVARKDQEAFVADFLRSFSNILFWVIPASMLFFLLRAQIVRVILGSGVFSWEATQLTAATLGVFALSVWAQSLLPLLVRSFFALKDTLTPLLMSLVMFVFTVLFSFLFSFLLNRGLLRERVAAFMDLEGIDDFRVIALPAAFGVATIVQILLLLFVLTIRMRISRTLLFKTLVRFLLLVVPAILVVRILLSTFGGIYDLDTFFEIFFQGAFAGVAGFSVYLILAWMFRFPELSSLRDAFRRQFSSSEKTE